MYLFWIIALVAFLYFLIKYKKQIEAFLSDLFSSKDKEYTSFVLEHSLAIRELREINAQYVFSKVSICGMNNRYDNEAFYESISPKDYLTYQLVYQKKSILEEIKNAESNRRLFSVYRDRVDSCTLERYDTDVLPEDTERLKRIEYNQFKDLIKRPVTEYYIDVTLYQTLINGRCVDKKSAVFHEDEIIEIIELLGQRRDGFYLNDEIWESICRVERGRVSNKMRFAIYERDGHRCRKCGRRTGDLEIDHIFPISKGGKSTFDNLQTLCHDCNVKKSNTVERGAINPQAKRQGVNICCEICGAPMKIVKGRYGDFYGCSNYPKCKYTKQK